MKNEKPVPLYLQIYDAIKEAIESGRYQPKERIPSEPELAEEYGVSRITIRRAVEELASAGYLIKQQGRGTFVSVPHIDRRLLQYEFAHSFTDVCRDNNMKPGAIVINRQIVPAHTEEREFFGIEPGTLLLYIQRVRTADGQPIFEENNFLLYDTYKDLLNMPLEDVSIFNAIESISGCRPSTTKQRTVEAVRASTEQAERLSISPGDPLLYLIGHFCDTSNRPVCLGRQYYVGSRYRFVL